VMSRSNQAGSTERGEPEIAPRVLPGREGRILSDGLCKLSPDLAARTLVLPPTPDVWWEKALRAVGLGWFADRTCAVRRAWAMFRQAPRFAVVVSNGYLEGLAFAALERFRGRNRPVHAMYDCLWYGGGWLRRVWMRFCLRQVDRCIVWASVERERYAKAYGVPQQKFLFVPHHDTLHARYRYEMDDEGYIFTGGNSDRDYRLFFAAVRNLAVSSMLATNQPRLLASLEVPPNVKVLSASPAEFRQLMARAHLVVLPLRGNLLRTAGHQTFLNAMKMGKPVILTDPEAGSDYIENGKTGVLVPYGDVPALRAAIAHLLAHPEEARQIGERARCAAARFTTERCNVTIWNHALRLVDERSTACAGIPPEAR
jgi:glycosyltransferase involved in cell wall biosynthesis